MARSDLGSVLDVPGLIELLNRVRWTRDDEVRARFNQSLPFADGLFDRWERARRLGFGEGTSIYDSALVYGEVKVGANTWIGPYTVLDGSGGGLSIGSYCSISAGVHIYTHDTVLWALSGGRHDKRTGPVAIGNCCYIGSQTVLVHGVTVGNRCVIAANSLVNRDVPEGSIMGGSPAEPIGRIEGEGEAVRLVYFHNQ